MDEDTFLLLSLKEEKSKKLAEAISNKTSRLIIDFLTNTKEATETEISERLDIPLPTVHYNLDILKEARLVETKEFFWSRKGKKIRVYKLSKKLIVIAPSNDENLLSKLKSILPIALIGTFFAGLVKLLQNNLIQNQLTQEAAATGLAEDSALKTSEYIQPQGFEFYVLNFNIAYFLIGLYLAVILFLIFKKK